LAPTKLSDESTKHDTSVEQKPVPIRIKKLKNRVTIRQNKTNSGTQIVTLPQENVITIENINTEKGPPNIQINYHTYITNYQGCCPHKQNSGLVLINQSEENIGQPIMSARNYKPMQHKNIKTFVNNIFSPREAPKKNLFSEIEKPISKLNDSKNLCIKLNDGNGTIKNLKKVSLVSSGSIELDENIQSKLLKNIRKSNIKLKIPPK